ncbi:hypothetical protein HU200_029234 [Digitaria exilis]|uniref:Wall-associated receptor kinase galacturonan-binding domain-containing protein n=1 Tax=Digitaria exilis TaxID=1010633 RepID=A0A835BU14_9POAL|nr:hypothetical protein HU200_029234 [Digitaria exilis]
MSTMAPSSAAVLFPAAVALLMAMTLRLSAAVVPPQAPPIGQPGCKTTCGNVSVPYPFGFGPSRCYWPGLNLTCDTSHSAPPPHGFSSVTARSGSPASPSMTRGPWKRPCASCVKAPSLTQLPVAAGTPHNELIVFGCNVVATLLADAIGGQARIGGCASLCSKTSRINTGDVNYGSNGDCSAGVTGCCREVQATRLYSGSDTTEENKLPVNVFVAEKGWINNMSVHAHEVRERHARPASGNGASQQELLRRPYTPHAVQEQKQHLLERR